MKHNPDSETSPYKLFRTKKMIDRAHVTSMRQRDPYYNLRTRRTKGKKSKDYLKLKRKRQLQRLSRQLVRKNESR